MGSIMLRGSELAQSLNQRDDELYHFGIKGMKWGVRRFQRKDGTRTSAGKKRERDTWKRKDAKGISDEELRKRIQRLETERRYKNLMESDGSRAAKDIARNIISSSAGRIVGGVATGAALYGLHKYANKRGKGAAIEKIYEYGFGKKKKNKD